MAVWASDVVEAVVVLVEPDTVVVEDGAGTAVVAADLVVADETGAGEDEEVVWAGGEANVIDCTVEGDEPLEVEEPLDGEPEVRGTNVVVPPFQAPAMGFQLVVA